MLLLEHNIKPWEVDALDADFVDDLLVVREAKAAQAAYEHKRAEIQAKMRAKRG